MVSDTRPRAEHSAEWLCWRIASVEVKPSGQADSGEFLSISAKLTNANGLTDVCVVARCADKGTELGLNWIEFQP